MAWMFRTSLVLALVLGTASSVLAQEPKPSSSDPAQLLQRLETLYPRALHAPELDRTAADPAKARDDFRKANEEWRLAVESLAKTGDEYLGALGGAAPEARGLYYRGFGKAARATLVGASESQAYYEAAVDSLQRYLDATDEKAAFRGDAELHLGNALIGAKRHDEAVVHLGRAVDVLQRDSRHDEAGTAAAAAMKTLKLLHRDADLRDFAKSIHASEGDFGKSTPMVRMLLAASRLSVGSPLPELPEVKDADGKPISWAPGKPMLLHFFITGFPGGLAAKFREIETDVRPLWEKYKDKGLSVVGVSMDYEIPKQQLEDLKAKRDDAGDKRELRDGSFASVKAWAEKQGVEWPWTWDGKWTNNPVSLALGGVGFTSPYALLVDKDGIVRWHGEAPFKGLPDEVAKLFP